MRKYRAHKEMDFKVLEQFLNPLLNLLDNLEEMEIDLSLE
jgi:hypothetical protein